MSKIPEGYSSVTPYVTFDDPAAAIEFYKKALGADEIMRFASPDGSVAHAEIRVGNAIIMLGAPCAEKNSKSARTLEGSPVSFCVYVADAEEAFKRAESAGMTEKSPLQDMFWGDRMGRLKDPFGFEWSIAQRVREVSHAEVQEAVKKMAS